MCEFVSLVGLWLNPLVVSIVFLVLVGAWSSLKLQSLTCDSYTEVQVLITQHVVVCGQHTHTHTHTHTEYTVVFPHAYIYV